MKNFKVTTEDMYGNENTFTIKAEDINYAHVQGSLACNPIFQEKVIFVIPVDKKGK